MEFLQGPTAQAFVLTAGFAGAFAALGLARDAQRRIAAAGGREALLAPIGIITLALAYGAGASQALRLMAGALLLTSLALLAVASRRDRAAPGRRIGLALGWASVAIGLAGAFLPDASAPDSPA